MRAVGRTLLEAYRAMIENRRERRGLKKVQDRFREFPKPYKLHAGCGAIRIEGWVNIDSERSGGAADIIWDLTRGIPIEDGSCKLIYCEHMLEHLQVDKGVDFLRECRRVLQPGGTVRIAMPSLDVLIEKSQDGKWREQDWLNWPEYQFIQTRAEMLNVSFRWWGHQWLYDREELHRRFQEAGFSEIIDTEWGRSDVEGLIGLESRKDSLLICESAK